VTRAALPKPPLASAAALRSPSPREDLDMSHEILAVITALDRRVDAALGNPVPPATRIDHTLFRRGPIGS
jgi:hypothetical protein